MLTETNQFILKNLISEVTSHNLKSGEIILCLDAFAKTESDTQNIIKSFLLKNSIKTGLETFEITEITQEQAVNSIKYGLSTKPDYTSIDIEFSAQDQNKIAYGFLQLFDMPTFYSINSKIFRTHLDLADYWESGGAIAIDKKSIGILWINDLYDKF